MTTMDPNAPFDPFLPFGGQAPLQPLQPLQPYMPEQTQMPMQTQMQGLPPLQEQVLGTMRQRQGPHGQTLGQSQRQAQSPSSPDDGSVALTIIHETLYHYAARVEQAHHLAYLKPLDQPCQRLESFTLDIEPEPSHCTTETDVYGNARSIFEMYAPHDALRVSATSRVIVRPRFEGITPEATQPWEDVAHALRYVAGGGFRREVEFTFASPYVAILAPLRDYARASFTAGRPLAEAAIELMQRVHADFTYASCSTDVSTPMIDAFMQRRGVCQDFAHVMLGCLRAVGLAARYVSGYLMSQPPPGQARLIGADASHAWVAVHCPGLGRQDDWLDLDPTNGMVPAASHAMLAWGRDYGDVTPLRGVIRGGGGHDLTVRVTVAPDNELIQQTPLLQDTP
ncbi:transglutaminase [Pigmentiphaga litoralis]|uniref:transglutaminase family protein n=1 Tax=Pigmentiphaga litoralis TaxID=516702 RepID=UPI0019CBA4FE|nr:transglutaminase family protein [Pigmentiphaga litoralis]GGX31465.1 transglutaminase [Pigmentiphaga litoralis]